MGRKPTVSDYGGKSYPGGRQTRLKKSNVLSFRCRDCKTVRYVLPHELGRAAQPRCLACGGPLEETETSHERHLERTEAIRAIQSGKRSLEQKRTSKKNPVCSSCGAIYSDGTGLAGHLRRNNSCRQSYVTAGRWGEYKGKKVLQGTGVASQVISEHPWSVTFLCVDGEFATVNVRGKQGAHRIVQQIAALLTPPLTQ